MTQAFEMKKKACLNILERCKALPLFLRQQKKNNEKEVITSL